MRRKEFDKLYPKYRPIIQAIARKLARQDDDLCADLEQEGACLFWQINTDNAHTNLDSFLRTAAQRRMIDYLRRNRPHLYESLDHRLACGDQVEQLENGELILISDRPRAPRLHDDDGEQEAQAEDILDD